MNSQVPQEPKRIWALLGARSGDNDQVVALAEALGLPFEIKRLQYNRLHVLGPRILGRSLASLTSSSRADMLSVPPPDVTLSTGHRSVPVVQALRHRSAGRLHSIHVGFPRVSPDHFDLVITTPQYPIAEHPHLLRIPYALTSGALDQVPSDDVQNLPSPRRLLIVGGPTLYWKLDQRRLVRTLAELLGQARDQSGSVVLVTSPRTPGEVAEALTAMLDRSTCPSVVARPGGAPTYSAVLAGADTIHVTADSVSMISDAIWTRKPMAIVPIANSLLGRFVFGVMNRVRSGERVYPQDLRSFWKALAEIGIGERLTVPHSSTDDVMRAVVDRATRAISARVSAASGDS